MISPKLLSSMFKFGSTWNAQSPISPSPTTSSSLSGPASPQGTGHCDLSTFNLWQAILDKCDNQQFQDLLQQFFSLVCIALALIAQSHQALSPIGFAVEFVRTLPPLKPSKTAIINARQASSNQPPPSCGIWNNFVNH